MSITSVYSYLCKWRQCQHNPHTTTRSLNRKKYIQVKVGTAGESFPYLAQYGDIIGVKFQVAQYRVTSTDSEGNTEVRDLPELELVRFTRDARQNLWQHQFNHSEQALGIPMWEVEHETVDGLVEAEDIEEFIVANSLGTPGARELLELSARRLIIP